MKLFLLYRGGYELDPVAIFDSVDKLKQYSFEVYGESDCSFGEFELNPPWEVVKAENEKAVTEMRERKEARLLRRINGTSLPEDEAANRMDDIYSHVPTPEEQEAVLARYPAMRGCVSILVKRAEG